MDEEKQFIILSVEDLRNDELHQISEVIKSINLPYKFLVVSKKIETISKEELGRVLEELKNLK